MMCVAPFQAPGRFIKLIALLELPARGHVFNAVPVNQHRRGAVPEAGLGAPVWQRRGYPSPQELMVLAKDTRLTPMRH